MFVNSLKFGIIGTSDHTTLSLFIFIKASYPVMFYSLHMIIKHLYILFTLNAYLPMLYEALHVGFSWLQPPECPLPYPSLFKHVLKRTVALIYPQLNSKYLHSHSLTFFMPNKKYNPPFFKMWIVRLVSKNLESIDSSSFFFHVFFFVILLELHFKFMLPLVKTS